MGQVRCGGGVKTCSCYVVMTHVVYEQIKINVALTVNLLLVILNMLYYTVIRQIISKMYYTLNQSYTI
jgi:hypothetical protein